MCSTYNTELGGWKSSIEDAERDPRGALTRYLEFVNRCRGGMRDSGYEYCGMHDFLLRHGKFYEPSDLAEGMWTGASRRCYGNAIILGVKENLRYVEGIAISGVHPIPIDHAWNTGHDSKLAIDCTWEPLGRAYFGVEFSVERADDATWNGDATVLNDYHRRHPLFREPWKGEDWLKVWPRSPRIALINRNKHAMKPLSDADRCAERLRDLLKQSDAFRVVAVIDGTEADLEQVRRLLTLKENARLQLRCK
jgi:hypothetical protein